jgi:hypothetical protein
VVTAEHSSSTQLEAPQHSTTQTKQQAGHLSHTRLLLLLRRTPLDGPHHQGHSTHLQPQLTGTQQCWANTSHTDRKQLTLYHPPVHCCCCIAPLPDGPHHKALPAPAVPSSKHARDGRGKLAPRSLHGVHSSAPTAAAAAAKTRSSSVVSDAGLCHFVFAAGRESSTRRCNGKHTQAHRKLLDICQHCALARCTCWTLRGPTLRNAVPPTWEATTLHLDSKVHQSCCVHHAPSDAPSHFTSA